MVEDGRPQVPRDRSRKQAQPGYYLAREAAEKLGIARSTFYSSYVEPGLIPRDIPEEGRSEGQYLAELIDALVPVFERRASLTRRQLRQEIVAVRDRVIRRKPVAATDWIREEDLPFLEYLDLQVYGPQNTVPMAITWEWWQRNPRM